MINLGTANLDHWKDDWTAVTLDGRYSAQFEETLLYVLLACRWLKTLSLLYQDYRDRSRDLDTTARIFL